MSSLEFILLNLPAYQLINILAFILGIINFSRGKIGLPFFTLYLAFLIILEALKLYWGHHYKTNHLILNISGAYGVLYYLYVYYDYFKERKLKKLIPVVAFLIFLSFVFRVEFDAESIKLEKLTYLAGITFVIILIIKYFYDILYRDHYRSITKDSLFYFSLGIFLFYVSCFPTLFSFEKISQTDFFSKLLVKLLHIGNIFLSLGYLGAVLCMTKQNK
jgi:hypothetical protein